MSSTPTTPLLVCRDVVAGYTRPVIGPVSLRLDPGEAVGLLGANGVGKSTLLRAITGQARVFDGVIERAPGLRVAHHAQHPERPQETPLTGRDLLRLTGAHRRPCPARLRPLLRRRLDLLSGGQFQLLHAWACLGGPAQLVLLDEPTGNLDRDSEQLLRELLLDREREGRAVLLVSHDAQFLERVCTRMLRLAGAGVPHEAPFGADGALQRAAGRA